jgi:two-component system phosphate regulon sensor histidine kinase PhoR
MVNHYSLIFVKPLHYWSWYFLSYKNYCRFVMKNSLNVCSKIPSHSEIIMKKRTIWMILGLMSIALLGVIVVQVAWLARASSLEERLFTERVNQAMERVVRQLEARELKAQVMKSLSNVRRTVNDAKVHQFKQKSSEKRGEKGVENEGTRAASSLPIAQHPHSKTPRTAVPKLLADSSALAQAPNTASSAPTPQAPPNPPTMRFQTEQGSFEMHIGGNSFSMQTSRTHGAQPSFVVTVPSNGNDNGQPMRIVIPQNLRSLLKNDSLAERIKSRIQNMSRNGQSRGQQRSREAITGTDSKTTPEMQPFIGGRKTLEDRMSSTEMRRRMLDGEVQYQQDRKESVQRNLSRSLRDLERLRRMNIATPQDMRTLDSTFQASVRQAFQDFGSFGFEFQLQQFIPNIQNVPDIGVSVNPSAPSVNSSVSSSANSLADSLHKTSANTGTKKNTYKKRNMFAQQIPTKASNNQASTVSSNIIARDTIEKIIERMDFVEHLMETMFTGKRVVTERVSMNDIDSLLRNELENNSIREAFEYGIVRGAGVAANSAQGASGQDGMMIVKSANRNASANTSSQTDAVIKVKNAALLASNYRAKLFPNDLFTNDEHYLVVSFPKYSPGLSLASIAEEIGLSATFLLMIVGCFGFTLVALVKQKKLSDMKTDFINNMTHELKTPIATISIASEALKDDHVRSEEQRVERFVNIIHDENKRLAGHVEKVLQAAQMDRGDLKLNLQTTDVHTLVEAAAESLSLQVEQKQGRIELALDASNPSIQADETHLMNVIFNLLDNANKYTPEMPHLRISTRNTAQGLALTIQDNGIGMTREAQKHIFEKFYRVPTGNRHDVKGFGLGLNYVQTIIAAHGGSISVKSDLGKGSTFEVLLPFSAKQHSTTSA